MLDFAARSLREHTLRVLRITEVQRRGTVFLGERGLDSSSLPGARAKAYSGTRDPATIRRLMVHITGVDGFGVARYQKYRYRRPDLIPDPFRDQLEDAAIPVEDWARIAALCHRYRNGTPYHMVGSQAGYVIDNKPLRLWTVHGQGTRTSGGNAGTAVAFDCSHRTTLDDFLIETFRAALYRAYLRWEAVAPEDEELQVVTHRQAKHPGRAQDPGGPIYREVVVPVAQALPRMRLDPEWTYKTGRPVPGEWY